MIVRALLLAWLFPLGATAAELPVALVTQAPFPAIHTQAPTFEPIAPGVTYGEYLLTTDAGPLAVHVLAVEPHRADVRMRTVLAHDELTSPGETVSSMAMRTGAIAGINGDYFDIGATNRPTNVVVREGDLVRTPRRRAALIIGADGTPRIEELAFTGTLMLPSATVPLNAINELPPPLNGISLLTPAFGEIAPHENLTLVALDPLGGSAPFTQYRVSGVVDNLATSAPGYYLAVGVDAYATGVPNAGATIAISGDLSPDPLAAIGSAIGGGPVLLRNGVWNDDPDGPNGGEYALRIPSSGAAIADDGTLLLIEVDGREPDGSVGLTRREFSALMRALGARDGMAFDGGGSSAMLVRRLGTRDAVLATTPSDGFERPVADGLFVYSSAPVDGATRIVGMPGVIHAVPGAAVAVHPATIDDAEHVVPAPAPFVEHVEPSTLGTLDDGIFHALAPGDGAIVVQSGTLTASLPVHVEATPARLEILPHAPNVARGASTHLTLRAYDARGYRLVLPAHLAWSASDGRIDDDGTFVAGTHDADVRVTLGARNALTRVTLGSHAVTLDISNTHFLSAPPGGEGSVESDPRCVGCIRLHYALGPNERAAYALAELPLPAGTLGLSFDLFDDGSGARLRVALRNAINEQVLVTATTLDHPGWRHLDLHFPTNLAQPARFVGLYVIGTSANATLTGSVTFKDVRAIVAGAPEH